MSPAAGGIGSAISQSLAQDGYPVVANYVVPDSHKAWLDAMRGAGFSDAEVAFGDVGDGENHRKKIGSIDVLVNCAGITRDSQFRKMTKQQWDAVIPVNLNSAFNVTRHVIDGMIERGWGLVINISSVNGQKR